MHKINSDFSSETVGPRKQWANIVKMIKEIDCLPRILYPAKTYLRNEGEIKIVPDKQEKEIHH